MSFSVFHHIGLRRLILLLAVMSALITLANSFYATYRVQRELLITNTLESNRVYASKLAAETQTFFENAQQQLAYSATLLAEDFNNRANLVQEADRLRLQTHSFNSVLVADAKGVVRATSPDTFQLIGQKLTTEGALAALKARVPLISQPYISAAENLIVMISSPIFDRSGRYLGFVGGSIYLKKTSILNTLLGQHYYRDGSYIYVTDGQRRMLYHKDNGRIGQTETNNLMVPHQGPTNGSQQMVNYVGEKMLAGFAVVPATGWEVVALRPTLETLKPLEGLMLNVLRHTLPMALLTILCVWLLARLIAQPLWLLARSANKMDANDISEDINKISSWYFEATQLKQAMLIGINLLQQKIGKLRFEAQTDPMTGLYNRRGLDTILKYWHTLHRDFAIVALDIDHFKRVNDTFGHDTGDTVIKFIAEQLRAGSRDSDILCRSGGEEFLVLLPETSQEMAEQIAERLRINTEAMASPAGNITISLGVSLWRAEKNGDFSIDQALKLADKALYRAKQEGRNRVVLAPGA
ncbi:sensor domain-containing diguanylate cyclase [Candidatus Symbiopectobacterium sp. NZEC135]|uniref:sensor domain-containing diguanylate cyclase n=1 Tax=Candidatus Symbiopectobacterium sp. NZEC135 TaxID=2820471 RepID=UPI002227985D|nr:sensor domain-containing diguanylate cyclase [Candidatus Symbiopectobacterium sp. NZEC135]MCW2477854.1 GGDEF domain-containing protein [Candidatus Symbiopectobacterium sp. NZEC135]